MVTLRLTNGCMQLHTHASWFTWIKRVYYKEGGLGEPPSFLMFKHVVVWMLESYAL